MAQTLLAVLLLYGSPEGGPGGRRHARQVSAVSHLEHVLEGIHWVQEQQSRAKNVGRNIFLGIEVLKYYPQ